MRDAGEVAHVDARASDVIWLTVLETGVDEPSGISGVIEAVSVPPPRVSELGLVERDGTDTDAVEVDDPVGLNEPRVLLEDLEGQVTEPRVVDAESLSLRLRVGRVRLIVAVAMLLPPVTVWLAVTLRDKAVGLVE